MRRVSFISFCVMVITGIAFAASTWVHVGKMGVVETVGSPLHSASLFEVSSTLHATTPAPVMTTAQVAAISSPQEGDMAGDNQTHHLKYHNGTAFKHVALLSDFDNSTIDVNGSNQFEVKALGVGTAQLAANAVTSAKIAAGAVGTTQLGTGAVATTNIAAGAVGTTQLGTNAVATANIAAGAVGSTQIATGGVTSAKLQSAIDLPSNATIGGVGINTLLPRFVWGCVNAAGTTQAGSSLDFTSSWNGGNIYTIDISPSFSRAPSCTATAGSTGFFGNGAVIAVNQAIFNTTGGGMDFCFICVGTR